MSDDLRELLELLKFHEVEFVVIGAHAVGFYARPRMTEDLDLLVGRTIENAKRLAAALKEFGASIGDDGAQSFANKDRQLIRIGVPPNVVDILNFGGTVPFDRIYADRVSGSLFEVEVWFPSKDHLLEMKRAAGRPQDLADIDRLER